MWTRKLASPYALESACEQTIAIAKLLTNLGDRLAVFSTACRHVMPRGDGTVGCQLYPLQRPSRFVLENELQCITRPVQNHLVHDSYLCETIDAAAKTLGHDNIGDGHSRCIIVITPDASDLTVNAKSTISCNVHVLSSAAFPLSMPQHPLPGWFVNTIPPERGLDRPKTPERANWRSIEDLVAFERKSIDPGFISNVRVYIEPGVDSELDFVIGDLSFPSLRPGESLSIPLKLKMKPFSRLFGPSSSRKTSQGSMSSTAAFAEVELMLGEALSELFTVEVHYTHSLFPPNTDVIVKETCWVLRTDPAADYSPEVIEEKTQGRRDKVHGNLAMSMAAMKPPGAALSKLKSTFTDEGAGLSRPAHLELLKQELKFQVGVLADEYIMNHIESRRSSDGDSLDLELYLPGERTKPQLHEHTGNGSRRYGGTPDSPTTVIHRCTSPDDESPGIDAPRRIWREIRRESRARRGASGGSESADERLRELKKRALKNKRSVGADTLRSLALSLGGGGDGRITPWI